MKRDEHWAELARHSTQTMELVGSALGADEGGSQDYSNLITLKGVSIVDNAYLRRIAEEAKCFRFIRDYEGQAVRATDIDGLRVRGEQLAELVNHLIERQDERA